MEKLNDVVKNPSGFDSLENYTGETEFGDLLVVMTECRDSDVLTSANWEAALKMLGGEGENVVIHRFNHWACGWWKALCVKGDKVAIAEEILKSLEDYPVLDDNLYHIMLCEEADDIWKTCYSYRDRAEYIRQHRRDFEFNGFGDMLRCVRGEFFGGDLYDITR